MRLDHYLKKKHSQYSRSYLQKLIKAGKILVNKKIVTPHYQIKPIDKITEKIIPPEKINLSPDKSIKLNVIYEDENYLVTNKPTGLVVHPSESVKSHTLVNALLAHYPKIKHLRDALVTNDQLPVPSQVKGPVTNFRPGIIHRLDKDVSGLMVSAKTQLAFNHLKSQFQNHAIKKGYTGLVHGLVKKDSGEINLAIGRSKTGFKMSARTQPKEKDKFAITRYRVIKRYKNFTLLKLQTLTGRTHQIRVHLHAIGHPLVGDPIYRARRRGGKNTSSLNPQASSRLFLHADHLEFKDLQGNIKKFKLDLPEELQSIIKSLNAEC